MSPVSIFRRPADQSVVVALCAGFGLAALLLAGHPYLGIRADGSIYTLLAMRRLFPDSLDHDLFFRFGSQDAYTVFPALHAALIRHLGLEMAAWLLTRLTLLAELAAAWWLARAWLDRSHALLALALFLVVPSRYGMQDIFSYAEDTVTPRTLAQALTLFSLALALRGGWLRAGAAELAALLVHPLQAAAGVPMLLLLRGPHRARLLWLALGLVGLVLAAALAAWMPAGSLRMMDASWRETLAALAPFLQPDGWSLLDWQRAAVPLLTLGIALLVLPPGIARQVAQWALVVGCAGLLLFLVSAYVAPIALLVQGQAWRWTWLAKALAVLLLVPIGQSLWTRGANGRAVLALLAVAWWGSEEPFGFHAVLLSLLATLVLLRSGWQLGRLWIAVVAVTLLLASCNYALQGPTPLLLEAVLVIGAWLGLCRANRLWIAGVLSLCTAAAFAHQCVEILIAPPVLDVDALAQRLAPWRDHIRTDQAVYFPAVSWGTAMVLHRQAFFDNVGVVFSQESAREVGVRYDGLRAAAGTDANWFLSEHKLGVAPALAVIQRVCKLPGLDFIVLPVSYAVPRLHASVDPPLQDLYLYDCRDITASGAPVT